MKKDIDRQMQELGIDGIIVTGAGDHNPYLVYITGGAHLTQADYIKPAGKDGYLFHGSMEREEASKTGLPTRSYLEYPLSEYLKNSDGDVPLALARRYLQMLHDSGIRSGKVALFGNSDAGRTFGIFSKLQTLCPEISFTGLIPDNLLMNAMMTKDVVEKDRIRKMGAITTNVISKVAQFLSERKVEGNILVDNSGKPITIKKVKSLINLWLAENGAENPEGTIFASGRDAGIPHSAGNNEDILRLGVPIVFDIFPCEQGGGYFFDITRTWCLGFASDPVLRVYEQVKQVYDQIMNELEIDALFTNYQKRACELFEKFGHPTIISDPKTEKGYVHTIGHGVGLHIHERPASSTNGKEMDDRLVPGSVFTIEPGLYYPEEGLGVRLENTIIANENGFEVIGDYPMDLIIPMKM